MSGPSHEQNLIKSERDALREYVAVLSEADAMSAPFLNAHGWFYPQDILDRAEDLRDEIKAYREATAPPGAPRREDGPQ